MLPTFEADPHAFDARSPAAAYLETLLCAEVPSLMTGELEIVSIARRPGVLSKVAVRRAAPAVVTPNIGADHIARVRAQLDGEQIQVVAWQREPRRYITAALGLAVVPPMVLKPAIEHAQLFVGEIDLRGMDGWRGINRLLASALTGWRIRLTSVATTHAWRVLAAAMAQQRPLVAAVIEPTARGVRVEIEGLWAELPSRRLRQVARETKTVEVRVTRMNADEGRIVVSDQLGSRGQLALPLRS
jgi:transcription antitermination factor NusA-like protein